MADTDCETDEAHYDIPWEFIHRTNPTSFSTHSERPHSEFAESLCLRRVDAVLGESSKHRNMAIDPRKHSRNRPARITSSPNPSSGMAHKVSRISPTDKVIAQTSNADADRTRLKLNLDDLREHLKETGFARRERYREEELIHHGVDRLEAERRLHNCRIGSFLVRMRDNGSLALSIRANKGILHIKLELRDDRWVLGEGPSFGSVATVVSFYRSHELPIRGAERMLLSSPLLVSPTNSHSFV
ncbi:SH2 domain-containing adapter protein B [Toxocara canis]|uniref:SH2 domain-containing adapter protein B n=1 Tax=Toxocara canis TaxID=6265 RepID=A0A0B2VYJ4_TOXCA|nr:SH2 domain-containing adapter protein B [Toxocara canis]